MSAPNQQPRIPEGDNRSWFDVFKFGRGFKDETSDLGADILSRGVERARSAGNNVIDFETGRERVKGQSERERGWVKNHVLDRFIVDAGTDSERTILRRDLESAGTTARHTLDVANDNFPDLTDERALKARLDRYENLEDGLRQRREKSGLATDVASMRVAFDQELDRFAPDNDNHRRRMMGRGDVLRANWEQYRNGGLNFFQFLKRSFVDMTFEYSAVSQAVPVWNAGVELNRRKEQIEDVADPYLDATKTGARRAKKGLRAKREAEIEGTAVMLKVKDWTVNFSQSVKQVALDVARGRRQPAEIYDLAKGQLDTFRRSSPEAFNAYLISRRAQFLDLQKRETVAGLIYRTCDWYLKPQYRTNDSLVEELAEALPFYGTYAAIRDVNDENGLPAWMRYGFAGFNVGLDVLTVASFGAFTPVAIAARTAIGFGTKATAKIAVKSGMRQSAKTMASRAAAGAAQFSSREFLANLPRQTRKVLLSTTSAKLLTGYAAYTGLSHAVDYAFGRFFSEELIEEVAMASVDKTMQREFTEQQRRLIRMTSRTAVEFARSQPVANDNEPLEVHAGVAEEDERRREAA